MRYNNYNEFKDDLVQLREAVLIPALSIRVDKCQFVNNGKYDTLAEEKCLRNIYDEYKRSKV